MDGGRILFFMDNVLLVDVDSKIPNLALMKISTYEKGFGNSVDIQKIGLTGYPSKRKSNVIIDAKDYDRVWLSVIFTINKGEIAIANCPDVRYGGTGFDLKTKLPQEIDDLREDYTIYPENKSSYGFITRGCVRNCEFCFVPRKEGFLKPYRDWRHIVRHKKTFFLDNNFLAYEKHEEILEEMNDEKISYSFNQGLDIRLINDKNAFLLANARYLGDLTFAFDDINLEKVILKKLGILRKHISESRNLRFFVYVNPNQTIENILYRVEWLRLHNCLPYVMRDSSCWNSGYSDFYTDLASYCNQPQFFKKKTFENFLTERYYYKPHHPRINRSLGIWNDGMAELT